METAGKFSGAPVFQLEVHEARADAFFWQYRSGDGTLVAESPKTYTSLEKCVCEAYEFVAPAVPQLLSRPAKPR